MAPRVALGCCTVALYNIVVGVGSLRGLLATTMDFGRTHEVRRTWSFQRVGASCYDIHIFICQVHIARVSDQGSRLQPTCCGGGSSACLAMGLARRADPLCQSSD